MFHIHRSCILLVCVVSSVFVVILLQTHSLRIDIFPTVTPHSKDKSLENEGELKENKIKILNNQRLPPYLNRGNNTLFLQARASMEGIDHAQEMKNQPLDTKLLEDHELLEGEVSDLEKASPDIVIKYDNNMFGLIDSDPTLHVWRTSFGTLGQVWPSPFSVTSSKNVFTICSWPNSLSFKVTGVDNYIIQNAIKRYGEILCNKKVSYYPSNWRQQEHLLEKAVAGKYIFKSKEDTFERKYDSSHNFGAILKGELRSVNIFVETKGHQWPSIYMNESYRLTITVKGIFISSKETWGLLRALESLSQLAWRLQSGRVFVNETKILDQPRFKYRGVMLDTARHFMAKEVILKNLDAMEMNKMNVFHWHISDDQSFPLVTENHAEFAKHGAYNFETKVYRPDDVKEILEYARLRGIRVVPEIDSPSHSLSWRHSHPEIMTRCIDLNGRWSGYYGPINMAAASTYRLLRSLFTDIVHLFPDQWIHLGSDEVPTSCLQSNPAIQKWMQTRNMYSVDLLTDFYMRKLQNILTDIGHSDSKLQRGYIVWQEAYERNTALKKGTIVQLWKSQSTSEAANLARQSIHVIYSACWYLDRLEYGAQWISHYQCDPGEDGGSMMLNDFEASQSSDKWKEYILGGEAAMWTEFIDSDNVLPRIWPLACAAAERLWSPSSVNSVEKASPRLEEMRCRMMTRSIPTGVAGGAGDCGQRVEGSFQSTFQERHILNSIVNVAETTSFSVLSQLLSKLISRYFLVLLLVVTIILCLYLHKNLRISTRRLMLIIFVTLSIYTLLWIVSQYLLLR